MTQGDPRALRVYVLTSASFAGRSHQDVAAAAIAGGATAVQLRAPELRDDELLEVAIDLAKRCRDAGVLFVVNDRPDVAVASGAGGAHVGQRDDLGGARAALGPDGVLGISVGSVEQTRVAVDRGADYVAVTVWGTPTKPEASPGGLELVREIAAVSPVPVVGIGGIDAANAASVLAAGAAGVAVISAVAAALDPVEATRAIARAVGTDHGTNVRGTG
jgi:thiamine-phosphate pyrophosphorylase